uniref:Uncharacterized protein n=1 Tax=Magallana gigas TaxID=29159 RepID=K1RMR1_MAGGI
MSTDVYVSIDQPLISYEKMDIKPDLRHQISGEGEPPKTIRGRFASQPRPVLGRELSYRQSHQEDDSISAACITIQGPVSRPHLNSSSGPAVCATRMSYSELAHPEGPVHWDDGSRVAY